MLKEACRGGSMEFMTNCIQLMGHEVCGTRSPTVMCVLLIIQTSLCRLSIWSSYAHSVMVGSTQICIPLRTAIAWKIASDLQHIIMLKIIKFTNFSAVRISLPSANAMLQVLSSRSYPVITIPHYFTSFS